MTMVASVQPPEGLPRTCAWADGRPKARYASIAIARRVAKRTAPGLKPYTCSTCGAVHVGHPTPERLTCARCGVVDITVASTQPKEGPAWPPMCAHCSSKVARMSALAVARG